jgi:hypothetical protein
LFKFNKLPLASKLFCLKVVSIQLKDSYKDSYNIGLYLKPTMPLISADEPLPPRGDMYEYFAPDSRLASRLPILFKFNKLPLASKLFWLLFSVPRLLLG